MILIAILILLAAIFNAIMDKIAHGKLSHWGLWWDPSQSWKLKWKSIKHEQRIDCGYGDPFLIENLEVGDEERFPLSSTVLVWLTDGWHLFQMLFHSCWQLGFAILITYQEFTLEWYWNFIIIKTVFSLVFELIYRTK